eukprot:3633039-Prymnesium_polylepis.1
MGHPAAAAPPTGSRVARPSFMAVIQPSRMRARTVPSASAAVSSTSSRAPGCTCPARSDASSAC